ncbi:hypothetical protein [Halomarina litorea]|uniref:hypothetical protein n=1 Tax=Halomarina litorea TaxID=2961595 RepID=UPI0020C3EFFE|nr:hypothetical protein [Halomarina sp. BCD28]
MATQSTPKRTLEPTSQLQAFGGTLLPGTCFTSGYCVWAYDFHTTPDGLDPFHDVWVVAPDGERTLIITSEQAERTIARNHPFDRTLLGDIRVEQPTPDTARAVHGRVCVRSRVGVASSA